MRLLATGILGATLVALGSAADAHLPTAGQGDVTPPAAPAARSLPEGQPAVSPSPQELTGVVQQYCVTCHNDRRLRGNLSLETFDMTKAPDMAPTAEKMVVKLRAKMMPPPGARRPSADTLQALVETLEHTLDEAAEKHPNPGHRTFQRLNRAEYAASIKALLDLDVDAGKYLPLDTKSANFDNIADVQMMSPTLMDSYLNAASEIARLAVGNPDATPTEVTYKVPRLASQMVQVPGAPYGSRGGVSVIHNFPADGSYVFQVSFQHNPEGIIYGRPARDEAVDVSVDGERVALLKVDRFTSESDPAGPGLYESTDPIQVRAGPHRISAVFVPTSRGPSDDLISPHGNSITDTQIGMSYGISTVPHLRDLTIKGPSDVTGVSQTPSRAKIFTCRPLSPEEERPCAERIIGRLGAQAFRRPLEDVELKGLMGFYDDMAADNGFEIGVRTAIEAILASPQFLFRLEEWPGNVKPGETYRITDDDLASRLSFFLWGAPPDQQLLDLAEKGKLHDRKVLEQQTRRMLADRRSMALSTRFAAQWLRLQDMDKVDPDVNLYPDFTTQLADDMRQETELFFDNLVREDRSALDLLDADYTFVNEALARHYGIPGVVGKDFRKVAYPDARRRGILGQGSVLLQTSMANRTSPVLRGKWIMEVLLGTPPPPPPPGVPDLEQTKGNEGTRQLTTGERMALHRAAPTCNACHRFMDPIGLSLDNFDVTGAWRTKENGAPLDTKGELYDGTPLTGPADLAQALNGLRVRFLRNFTQNLMAYALGRRVEYYDMPQVRQIVRNAEGDNYKMSDFILGVVDSDAFQMKTAPSATTDDAANQDGQRR